MKTKCITYIALVNLFLYTLRGVYGYADTMYLKDGSLLVGKVVHRKAERVVFKNSYGIFTINTALIKKVYITQNYLEDVEVHKMLHQNYDEASIKKNFLSGLDKKNYIWSGGQVSMDMFFLIVTGDLGDVLPFGISMMIIYDQGFDFVFYDQRNFWMPGLRLETGYLHFEKEHSKIIGYVNFAGPLWYISIHDKHPGRFFISVLPGLAVMKIEKSDYHARTTTFALHSCFGYEYSLGNIFLSFSIDNMYIYDRDIDFTPLGFRVGAGYELW